MGFWPEAPVMYEINTWVWLQELSRKYKRPVTLTDVPCETWDSIAGWGFDAVWLMGVWARSPAGTAIANQDTGLLEEFRRVLPDYRVDDNVGSPYCVRQYVAERRLGGPEGLAVARKELAGRGTRLVLDFIPNHVAPDHPWVFHHPEYLIQGSSADLNDDPSSYLAIGEKVFACGRDPYFPPWRDVLQLNAFRPGLRRAAIHTLADIAGQCDVVRCDMAMLLLNSVFERTWGGRAGKRPATEYWAEVISAVKKSHPDFLFMAEAYWNLEWELQRQGFDYCYDKRLYDRLVHNGAEGVRRHLEADIAYQQKLVRFIENHDEPRALAAFPPPAARAAAVTMATVPGARLFHEGQLEGRKIRLPVFLGRRPDEPFDPGLQAFYRRLLQALSLEGMGDGLWQLCERTGLPANSGYSNLVAWCWRGAGEHHLIVVNLSDSGAQGRVLPPWDGLKGKDWRMADHFTGDEFEQNGDDLCARGLYVDLPPWGFHFLTRWRPVG